MKVSKPIVMCDDPKDDLPALTPIAPRPHAEPSRRLIIELTEPVCHCRPFAPRPLP